MLLEPLLQNGLFVAICIGILTTELKFKMERGAQKLLGRLKPVLNHSQRRSESANGVKYSQIAFVYR